MYSTCLFCNQDLGANEAIEHFPVGRRLAFDAERGRLWVVCRRCERWNLSPLEERWEAIEECERRFSATRMRVSTENVGLAKLSEGLELVRIGSPQRPEFAAWRYGDQFGRRRRKRFVQVGLGLGAFGAVLAGGAAAGVGIGGFAWFLHRVGRRIVQGDPQAVVARLPTEDELVEVRRKHLPHVELFPGDAGAWRLLVPHRVDGERELREFTGPEAVRAAGLVLPAINRFGGTREQVGDAVRLLESAPDPLVALQDRTRWQVNGEAVAKFPHPVRLALEMAAHEEQERRALEGELAMLEAAWREAEEIAAISDDLLVPAGVRSALERMLGR
ncbi:hypothetical protein BH20GEM2_BH20GEM2_10660 [soil metagenome]